MLFFHTSYENVEWKTFKYNFSNIVFTRNKIYDFKTNGETNFAKMFGRLIDITWRRRRPCLFLQLLTPPPVDSLADVASFPTISQIYNTLGLAEFTRTYYLHICTLIARDAVTIGRRRAMYGIPRYYYYYLFYGRWTRWWGSFVNYERVPSDRVG